MKVTKINNKLNFKHPQRLSRKGVENQVLGFSKRVQFLTGNAEEYDIVCSHRRL